MLKNSSIRAPSAPAAAFRRFLYDAFVLPFKDGARAFMYFVSFFFALGFAFLDIFIALDTAALGPRELTEYLVSKFGVILVVMPFALFLIGRIPDKLLFSLFLLSTLTGLGYIIFKGGILTPLEAGFLYGLTVSPFWAIYHVMFATATSDANIGNEVSLAGTGMTVGMTFGSVLGGLCSQFELQTLGMIIGFSVMICSTAILIFRALKTNFSKQLREIGALDETMWHALKRCRYRSVGSVLEGVMQLPTGNLWVVYLSLSGIAAAAVGTWTAFMVAVKVFFTPYAGALVNHGRRREMVLGSAFNLFGWAPFMFVTNLFTLSFMNVWAVGMQLFQTGLTTAWYNSRTVAAIMVREILLGLARTSALFVLIPILYADPETFIDIVIVLSSMMAFYAALWMGSVLMKGPVLPIENIVARG